MLFRGGDGRVEELVLVRYYHKDSEPMKSISALSKQEAEQLAKKLLIQSDCRAHRRFGAGFMNYYQERIKAEQWLYHQFSALGGKPELQHPLYFVLQPNHLRENFGDVREVRLSLREIEETEVSFTFGDSMANWFEGAKPNLILKHELLARIKACGSVEAFLKTAEAFDYIEAQLWTDRFSK